MTESCTDKIIDWLKKDTTKKHIKAAAESFTRRDIDKLVNSIKNNAKNIYISEGISWSEAIEKAQALKLEAFKEGTNTERVNVRLSAIKKAEMLSLIKANGNNVKKAESAIFSGIRHKGVGVRGGINAIANTNYAKLNTATGGILYLLQKNNGVALLRDRNIANEIVDQIIKQDFTNDKKGKIARIINDHNGTVIKLMRQAGIPIRELAGRVTKQYHDPIKLLNPKGLSKKLAERLGITKLEMVEKKIKSIGSVEFENLKNDMAFEMWRDHIKPRLDWNLSFMDIDRNNDLEIDKALRSSFYDIIHSVSPESKDKSLNIDGEQSLGRDPFWSEKLGKAEPFTRKRSIASRLASSNRKFFFKDGKSWVDYSYEYGAGGVLESIDRDMRSTSRAMGLVSMLGPNAEDVYSDLRTHLIKENRGITSTDKVIQEMDLQMRLLTGQLSGGTSSTIAQYAANMKEFNNATKLGAVVFHSIPDVAALWGTMSFNGMNIMEKIESQLTLSQMMFTKGSPEMQDFLHGLGVGVKHLIGTSNRFGVAVDSPSALMSKASSIMFKMNGLQWWDHGLKKATMAINSHILARHAGESFEELNPKRQRLLTLYNFKREEWDVLRKHAIETVDKKKYLSPDAILKLSDNDLKGIKLNRDQLHLKTLMFLEDQYKYTVPQASLLDQAKSALRNQTPSGAAINLIMQYKSFGINYFKNIVMRSIEGSDSRYEAASSMVQNIVGVMVLGYAGDVALEKIQGKKASSLNSVETWTRAILPALGIYGDFLHMLTGPKTAIASELGPTVSTFYDIGHYLTTMAERAFDSESYHNKSSRYLTYELVKRNLPFMNLFYVIALLNSKIGQAIENWIN